MADDHPFEVDPKAPDTTPLEKENKALRQEIARLLGMDVDLILTMQAERVNDLYLRIDRLEQILDMVTVSDTFPNEWERMVAIETAYNKYKAKVAEANEEQRKPFYDKLRGFKPDFPNSKYL